MVMTAREGCSPVPCIPRIRAWQPRGVTVFEEKTNFSMISEFKGRDVVMSHQGRAVRELTTARSLSGGGVCENDG